MRHPSRTCGKSSIPSLSNYSADLNFACRAQVARSSSTRSRSTPTRTHTRSPFTSRRRRRTPSARAVGAGVGRGCGRVGGREATRMRRAVAAERERTDHRILYHRILYHRILCARYQWRLGPLRIGDSLVSPGSGIKVENARTRSAKRAVVARADPPGEILQTLRSPPRTRQGQTTTTTDTMSRRPCRCTQHTHPLPRQTRTALAGDAPPLRHSEPIGLGHALRLLPATSAAHPPPL